MKRALLIPALLLAGCTVFGATLPPGNAGGTFVDAARPMLLRGKMERRRAALDAAQRQQLHAQFEVLRDLVASSEALRDQIQRRTQRLVTAFTERGEVGALEQALITDGAQWFIQLDALLYTIWLDYRRYLPNGSEPDPYAPRQAASMLSGTTRLKGGLVALAAEITRMENAVVVVDLLGDQVAMTRSLNRGIPELGIAPESYDRVVGSLYDPDRRRLMQKQLFAVARSKEQLQKLAESDGEVAFALALISESRLARTLLHERSLGRQLRFLGAISGRTTISLISPLVDIYLGGLDASKTKARNLRSEVVDEVFDRLEPMDIIFAQDGTRAGASLGMSHALIYLGDPSRFRHNPHPAYAQFGSKIRRGAVFLELTATGPQLYDLDTLLDNLSVVVARPHIAPDIERVLDLMVDPRFTNPPELFPADYSAELIGALYQAPTRQSFRDTVMNAERFTTITTFAVGESVHKDADAQRAWRAMLESAPTSE